jgi:Flp pilus assembly protein TadG
MLFDRILQDRKGGVAPLLALAIIPIIGAVGAAVDYSRANLVRTAMQNALDSSALMLSKDAQTLSSGQLDQKATSYFNAMFQRPEASNVQVTQQLTAPVQGTFNLKITGTATVSTMFWRVLGQDQISITATGEVTWGIKKLNLALALDNTGSMSSSNKMTELKTAAHSLLTTLKGAEKVPGDIKVSIVPFAVDVNVGTANVNADWIDWTDWEANNGTCSKSSYSSSQSNCTSHSGVWTPKNHSQWNGCVMDRDQNNDVLNTATVSGSPATKYRAHQATACPASMMTLSYDWTALNNKIDAMTPTGNTNVTIGLQMAWQTLSPVAPFSAPAPAPDLDKVLILLTDGTNTQNRWTSSSTAIDARTQKACDNAKADNIRIYTIRVIDGNATLLKGCASKPDMYYEVQQAGQLNSVFGSIAQNLANLRIAK